jgi:tRNA (guanine37-N1)-methyltransferase
LKDDELLNWRNHPALNISISFPTWIIPVAGKGIQKLLSEPLLQPYLATRLDILEHTHQRLKGVQDYHTDGQNRNTTHKVVLLHPDTPSREHLSLEVQQLMRDYKVDSPGPLIPVSFNYKQFTASYVLTKLLPPKAQPPPTSFETIGHVAHLNLRENHLPYKRLIGEVLLETLPTIETVIHKVGEVTGPFRTYDFSVVAGRPDTAVKVTESGIQMHFDVAEVYWSARLSEERQRILKYEIQPGDYIADAFCGVGAICLMAAAQLNCTISANDWNPKAVEYLKANTVLNGVEQNFKKLSCTDAYDFLMDLGLADDKKETRLPDHVLLNFPLEAPRFLGALRWWPVKSPSNLKRSDKAEKDETHRSPRVHVYTFARADPETNRSAEDVAVDSIASNLLPMGDSTYRKDELNNDYGCKVNVHDVRDVAPGKVVMCVSFSATPRLLRCMQGDFS